MAEVGHLPNTYSFLIEGVKVIGGVDARFVDDLATVKVECLFVLGITLSQREELASLSSDGGVWKKRFFLSVILVCRFLWFSDISVTLSKSEHDGEVHDGA